MKTTSKFNVVEKISRTFQAKNGLSLEVSNVNGQILVTFSLGGEPVNVKNFDAGLVVQMGEMLKAVEKKTKHVCASHGPYIAPGNNRQTPSCNSCMSAAQLSMDTNGEEEADA